MLKALFLRNKLQRNFKLLMLIHGLVSFAGGISGIFLNIFLWKVSNDIGTVILYNLFFSLSIPLAAFIAGWLGKKKGLKFNLIIGILLYAVFYFVVLWFKAGVAEYPGYLGFLKGLGTGFYYLGFNVLIYDFSNDENRAYSIGTLSLLDSMNSMIAPLIAAFIISHSTDLFGYQIIFTISFIIFFGAAIFSFRIPHTQDSSTYEIKKIFTMPFTNSTLRKIGTSDILISARDIVVSFIIGIFIFILSKKEFSVGGYSSITFLISTVIGYASGLIITPKNRLKCLLVGTILTAFASSIFLFNLSVLSLYTFGIIVSIFATIASLSQSTISYAAISSIPEGEKIKVEFMMMKELFYLTGRVISLYIFYLISSRNDLMYYFLFVLGVIQIFRWAALRKVDLKINN